MILQNKFSNYFHCNSSSKKSNKTQTTKSCHFRSRFEKKSQNIFFTFFREKKTFSVVHASNVCVCVCAVGMKACDNGNGNSSSRTPILIKAQ
jgi:hypothetical protein